MDFLPPDPTFCGRAPLAARALWAGGPFLGKRSTDRGPTTTTRVTAARPVPLRNKRPDLGTFYKNEKSQKERIKKEKKIRRH